MNPPRCMISVLCQLSYRPGWTRDYHQPDGRQVERIREAIQKLPQPASERHMAVLPIRFRLVFRR